jgi:hypothetical protein
LPAAGYHTFTARTLNLGNQILVITKSGQVSLHTKQQPAAKLLIKAAVAVANSSLRH